MLGRIMQGKLNNYDNVTEEYLRNHPEVCKSADFMKPVIKKNPSFIKYFIFGEEDLGYNCIANALFKYKLIEEDIENKNI